LIRLLTILLLTGCLCQANIALVQSRKKAGFTDPSTSNTVSLAYTSAVVTGNELIIGCAFYSVGTPTVTISDNHSNTWTKALTYQNGTLTNVIAYTTSSTSTTDTVSCAVTGGTSGQGIYEVLFIAEYSGVATGTATDGSSSGTTATAAGDCGSLTTTTANDMLFALINSTTSSSTWSVTSPPSGFTVLQTSNGATQAGALADSIGVPVQSAVSYTYTAENTDSATTSCSIVAFKPPGGAANPFSPAFLNQPIVQ
jgi:hypothetical protein